MWLLECWCNRGPFEDAVNHERMTMRSQFIRRFEGLRWTLAPGSLQGLEGRAAIDVQRMLQTYLPYVLPIADAGCNLAGAEHLAVVGTAASSPHIAALINAGKLAAPTASQGYSVAFCPSPWRQDARLLAVAGTDAHGVLYGAQEVTSRLAHGATRLDGQAATRRYLETCPTFAVCEAPAVPQRGLWSWGYTIYDYRRYLDHMMRLKMNTLIIWNDCVPENFPEVIDAAHARGIRVIAGFHWGWGFEGSMSLANAEDRRKIRACVLETYRTDYAGLNHDGIYFQTLTEHAERKRDGCSTASCACKLVNETARALLEAYPDLDIQFGLHASSIGEDYTELAELDARVTINWEDCGSLPFSYKPDDIARFEETLDYAKRLAAFRPNSIFAFVPKGWMGLRWDRDFENHGRFIMGERSEAFLQLRLAERASEWTRTNITWFRNYPLAARFYREILAVNPRVIATAAIGDCAFELKIQPSLALFAEMLWNPQQADSELLARAASVTP